MQELLSLLIIAIALSMDTFSLSLGLGTSFINKNKFFLFPLIVGLMHFLMPILGFLIGQKLVLIFTLKSNFLLGIILIYLAILMFIDIIKPNKIVKELNILSMFVLAISVSLDSFSTGIGIIAITNNLILATIIFSLTSFFFTYLGLLIGKYANKLLGIYASLLGSILLLIIGLFHLCKL